MKIGPSLLEFDLQVNVIITFSKTDLYFSLFWAIKAALSS